MPLPSTVVRFAGGDPASAVEGLLQCQVPLLHAEFLLDIASGRPAQAGAEQAILDQPGNGDDQPLDDVGVGRAHDLIILAQHSRLHVGPGRLTVSSLDNESIALVLDVLLYAPAV